MAPATRWLFHSSFSGFDRFIHRHLGLGHLHACSKLLNHALFNGLPTKRKKLPYVQYRLKRHFILNKSGKLTDLKHQELRYWVLIKRP
ncbi:hypothetical protein RHMOL_Rhmol02G0178600 [Rhododendron molle]|uniref:Uncharacterized protein n=1 Tax=Rhododendron molle TaxID=49168 RepID=A0ACC0PT16_RHOML|nr:hypothetical protein RHMOL_Rhmol02G0178600 [Rhododendron molle]